MRCFLVEHAPPDALDTDGAGECIHRTTGLPGLPCLPPSPRCRARRCCKLVMCVCFPSREDLAPCTMRLVWLGVSKRRRQQLVGVRWSSCPGSVRTGGGRGGGGVVPCGRERKAARSLRCGLSDCYTRVRPAVDVVAYVAQDVSLVMWLMMVASCLVSVGRACR